MRSCAWLLALAACSSDPVLHVTVTHPTGVAIASTTVSVYESKQFACQDIEYGDVDDVSLQAALVASETIGAQGTTGALTGLSRTDPKLVVARGFDASGGLLAAGCAEQGVVSGDAQLAITTELAAVVSYAIADPTGMTDLYGIATTVTDPSGKALDGRQVWWRVYGPAGTAAQTSPTMLTGLSDGIWEPAQPSCTTKGLATIHPVPPDQIGGYAIELRVAWAVDPPQYFSSFTRIDPSLTTLAVPTNSTRFCARHVTSGGPRLTCLDNPTGSQPIAYDFTVSQANGTATLSAKAMTGSQNVPADALDVFGIDNASGGHDVYAATTHCAVASAAGVQPMDINPYCPLQAADDIMLVPACGSEPARLLFHIPMAGTDVVRAVDPTGGAPSDLGIPLKGNVSFNAAGCVSELDPVTGQMMQRQVIVLDNSVAGVTVGTHALYACATTCADINLPLAGAGVGFTTGTEQRMVAAAIDATGVVLSQLVLLRDPSGAADRLVERTRQPAASVPISIAVGNFDGDGVQDLVWDVGGRRGTAFEVAYARMVNGQPLSALSGAFTAQIASLEVGDVTGDGKDDLVVTGGGAAVLHGVGVIPTRVAPTQVTLMGDTKPCAP